MEQQLSPLRLCGIASDGKTDVAITSHGLRPISLSRLRRILRIHRAGGYPRPAGAQRGGGAPAATGGPHV